MTTLDDEVLYESDETLETVAASDEPDPCAAIERLVGWSALDPAVQRLRNAVLEVLRTEWLPVAREVFHTGRFPREIFRDLGRLGALGASLWGRNGRPPLDRTATCAVMHAIEYGDGGLRCATTIQDCVIQAIVRFGNAEQQQRWLEPLSNGEVVAAFALTEPQAGSDLRAVSTRATRRGGDWVLTGQKSWVTNAPAADLLLVWARTGEANDTIRGFLVERGTLGVETPPIETATSMRAALVGRIHLDGARVPTHAMLPYAWGLADINACLDYNRLTVAFGVMGAARFCVETGIRYARSRHQFGVPIGSKQLVQAELADLASDVAAGEILSLHAARQWEKRPLAPFEVSLVKRSNCRSALQVSRRARALLGAQGIDFDSHVLRHLLNLEASYTYGGTHEIHGLVMGRALLGMHAF